MTCLHNDEEPSWVKIPEQYLIKPGDEGLKNMLILYIQI